MVSGYAARSKLSKSIKVLTENTHPAYTCFNAGGARVGDVHLKSGGADYVFFLSHGVIQVTEI